MENYEEILRNNLPAQCKMHVPEGYFDTLYSRIKANIDKEEASSPMAQTPKPILRVMRSWVATAACVGIIVAGVFTLLIEHSGSDVPQHIYKASVAPSTVDQAADYMMIDNDDIYAMLSE